MASENRAAKGLEASGHTFWLQQTEKEMGELR
jgi:hypothetical protein